MTHQLDLKGKKPYNYGFKRGTQRSVRKPNDAFVLVLVAMFAVMDTVEFDSLSLLISAFFFRTAMSAVGHLLFKR